MEKLLKKLKTDKYPWFGATLSSKEVAIVIDVLEKLVENIEREQMIKPGEIRIDNLVRYKWPEEKPIVPDEVEFKEYLARYEIDDRFIFTDSVAYYKDTGWATSGVTHWWHLPEVTE